MLYFANNLLAYDMNRSAGTAYYHKPRGSWLIKEFYAIKKNTGNNIVPRITDTDVYVKFEVTEPLLLSPFIFGSGYEKQGFYGIQSVTLHFTCVFCINHPWDDLITTTVDCLYLLDQPRTTWFVVVRRASRAVHVVR
ncbi:MAG: phage major capsid domain-containing protein [Candidatus Fonsibacter sp.]